VFLQEEFWNFLLYKDSFAAEKGKWGRQWAPPLGQPLCQDSDYVNQ
jgi:hypothetical protein